MKKTFLLLPCLPRRSVNEGGPFPRRRESHRPIAALFILALLAFAPTAAKADCTSPAGLDSQTIYDTSDNMLKFCDGTSWQDLAPWVDSDIALPIYQGIAQSWGSATGEHSYIPWRTGLTSLSGISTAYSIGTAFKTDASLVMVETDSQAIRGLFNLNDKEFTWVGTTYKPGGGSWTATSDARLKDIDGPYEAGLGALKTLRPVRFHYKKDNARQEPSDKQYIGLVAQEAMVAMPEMVHMRRDGYYDLDPTDINFALINAVRTLKERNERIKARIIALENKQ